MARKAGPSATMPTKAECSATSMNQVEGRPVKKGYTNQFMV